MRRLVANKRGQFIIIAILIISIMIISVAGIMYNAVTYFRQERWEEYLGMIDNVEVNTNRLVELSLANYTMTNSTSVLKTNLDKWQRDVMKTYAEFRVVLNYTLASEDTTIYYNQGLNKTWNQPTSFSAAKTTFRVNVTSVGLTGYKFSTSVLLRMRILDITWYQKSERVGVRLNVTMEGLAPLSGLQKDNVQFRVNGADILNFNMTRYYEKGTYKCFVYELKYSTETQPPSSVPILVTLIDIRNIKVVSQGTFSLTTVNA